MDVFQLLPVIATVIMGIIAFTRVSLVRQNYLLVKNVGLVVKQSSINAVDRTKLIDQISGIRNDLSDYALLATANKYSWPASAIVCLPSLYFKISENPNVLIVWKYVLQFLPTDVPYKIVEKMCGGEIIKISVPRHQVNVVNIIAIRIEYARLRNPFHSFQSVYGVINQVMIQVEKEFESQKNLSEAKDIQSERKDFLITELNLKTGPMLRVNEN